jgi:hypothetical protein
VVIPHTGVGRKAWVKPREGRLASRDLSKPRDPVQKICSAISENNFVILHAIISVNASRYHGYYRI